MINMDIIYIAISFLLVIALGYLLINFLSNGFLNIFMYVKASRGKRVLVKCVDVQDNYFKSGKIDEGYLLFTGRDKLPRRIIVEKHQVSRSMGVDVVDVHIPSNNIISITGVLTNTYDAPRHDQLYVRCLERPQIKRLGDSLPLIIGGIIILVLAGAGAYFAFKNAEAITALQASIDGLKASGIIG